MLIIKILSDILELFFFQNGIVDWESFITITAPLLWRLGILYLPKQYNFINKVLLLFLIFSRNIRKSLSESSTVQYHRQTLMKLIMKLKSNMWGSFVQLIGHEAFFVDIGLFHMSKKRYKNLMSTYALQIFLKLKCGFKVKLKSFKWT